MRLADNSVWVLVKPVIVPLGRDRLAPNPWPTGSGASAKMIGIAVPDFFTACAAMPEGAKMTSGFCASNSATSAGSWMSPFSLHFS